jgi:plasmid maintenance system antidote protein VapI
MSAETAVKLGKFFGIPPEFWMNLQSLYDIEDARKRFKKDIAAIRSVKALKEEVA